MHVTDRPTTDAVIPLAREYVGNGGTSLHIVLDDGNLADVHVWHCLEWALERGDEPGADLAGLLLQMTRSQRGRVAKALY